MKRATLPTAAGSLVLYPVAARRSSILPARTGPRILLIVLVVLITLVVLDEARPAEAQAMPETVLVGRRFEVAEPTVWRGLRLGFYAPVSPPAELLQLALHTIQLTAASGCELPAGVVVLETLRSAQMDLGAHPVMPEGSLWIGMPPKDEVWLTWSFDEALTLDPEAAYLATIEVAYSDAAAGSAVLDVTAVSDAAAASLVSFDGGDSFACLDVAAALAVLGVEHLGDGSPLLRIEIEPDP